MAEPAWTSTRSPGCTGPTMVVSTTASPSAVRTEAAVASGTVTTSASRPSSEQVTQAVPSSHASSAAEQPRVLEAHVGQLPQHVVQQHQPAVVRGPAGDVVDPQHVVRRARRAAGARDRSTASWPPTPGAAHRGLHDRVVGRADGDQHVAGADGGPQRGDRIGIDDAHGRQRPLPHDDRVHELHRDVAGVLRPGRRQAPHRRPGGEAAGQGEGGAGEVLAQAGVQPGCACDPCVDHGPPRRQREHAPRAARDATDPGCGTVPGAGSGRRMRTTSTSELAALSSERRAILEAFAEASSDALLAHDRQGRITTCNRSAERIVGYLEAEIVGQPISSLFPDHLRAQVAEVYDTVFSGDTVDHLETEVQRKLGMTVPVSLSVRPLRDERGSIVGAVSIAQDVTEMRLAQATAGRGRGPAAGRRGAGPRGPMAVGRRDRGRAVERRAAPDPRRRPPRLRRHARRATSTARAPTIGTACGESMEDAVRSGRPFEQEYRVVRPDGSERRIYLRAEPTLELGRARRRVAGHRPGPDRRPDHSRPTSDLTRSTRSCVFTLDSARPSAVRLIEHRGQLAEAVRGVRAEAAQQVVELLGLADRLEGLHDVVEVLAAGAGAEHVARGEGDQDPHQTGPAGSIGSASTCSCTRTSG